MNNINEFLNQHGTKIILLVLIFTYFKSCSIDRQLDRIERDMVEISNKNTEISDYTIDLIKQLPTALDLRIEGLNVENRMIQSTNRRMLDVERQNEIEREIKRLRMDNE